MNLKVSAVLAGAIAFAAVAGPAIADQQSSKMKSDLNMNTGASSGASTGEQGKTSDRTPGDASPDRLPGSTRAGAPGAGGAQTPEGTSDRTPNNNENNGK
ncbi:MULTISPECIES: hypothetical protein [unclassified Hyphomicrobium]|uniref:hypothetical protein n=1 Tax=unclassified Hyphomicrobium TaxID=2619925 RepID=UPI000213D8A8|nr:MULTISPECIES: hypothetical protein [unclassified Hyphomicrobium]CCB66918.1 conserved exported protein of unknown function [Hyphomicrobium sp. MC1]